MRDDAPAPPPSDPSGPPLRGALAASVRQAAILTGPGALAALIVGLIAFDGAGPSRLAFGIALGAAAGAGMAAWLKSWPPAEPAPEAPRSATEISRIEQREAAARDAAAQIGGPASSVAEALSDARLVLERMPLALFILDARGRIVFANQDAEREIGRRAMGAQFATLLRAPALMEAVREAYLGRPFSEVAFAVHRAQERHYGAAVRALTPHPSDPSTAADGAIYGHARVLVALQDQTGMRRAEQLHRDFVANASHELKTPIASIAGFVETLRGPARDDAEARQRFLTIMEQQADRMRRLVEDLLSLNRIELNEHVPPRDSVDLAALIREAVSQSPALQESRIELDLPEDGPTVRGDPGQIEQIIVNLVENAVKYGGDKHPVRVVMRERSKPKPAVGFTVEDFGPGIAKEHLPRLTERFYRVGAAPGQLKSGTGLGLSIVKHAVARHRGGLEIDSTPGRGSRFSVWLPPEAAFDQTEPAS